ncbi:MAG: hypothetical protein KDJ65_33725 [Anaerolineae bacterium]|nr:hypothetical protein [Anaerolineae bacterium]
MKTVRRISSGRVTADFFTSSYRFSASIVVYKRRLVDVLSDRMTDYLDIVDVYISRINAPGDIIATYKKGSLVKDEITFILLSDEAEGISKERFYTTRDDIPLFISLPSFEIHGQLKWGSKELDIKKLLSADTQKFLPVSEATATNSLMPTVNFQGPMVLVNKTKIQVLCGIDK